jgi:hypothetical protein
MKNREYYVGQTLFIHGGLVGKAVKGTVTRVGRELIDIDYPGGNMATKTFRMKGQRLDGPQFGSATVFRTEAQQAVLDRTSTAMKVLSDNGMYFNSRTKLSLEKLEAIAAIFTQED